MIKQYCSYQKQQNKVYKSSSLTPQRIRVALCARVANHTPQHLSQSELASSPAAHYYPRYYMFIVERLRPSIIVVNVLRVVRALQLKADLGEDVLGLDFALELRLLWLFAGFLRGVGGVLSVFGEDAVAVAVVLLEDVGDGGEADVVLLYESGHLDLLDVVEFCHIIFDLKLRIICYLFTDLPIGGALADVLGGEIVVSALFLLLLHRSPSFALKQYYNGRGKRLSPVSERNIAVHPAFALAVLLDWPTEDLSPYLRPPCFLFNIRFISTSPPSNRHNTHGHFEGGALPQRVMKSERDEVVCAGRLRLYSKGYRPISALPLPVSLHSQSATNHPSKQRNLSRLSALEGQSAVLIKNDSTSQQSLRGQESGNFQGQALTPGQGGKGRAERAAVILFIFSLCFLLNII